MRTPSVGPSLRSKRIVRLIQEVGVYNKAYTIKGRKSENSRAGIHTAMSGSRWAGARGNQGGREEGGGRREGVRRIGAALIRVARSATYRPCPLLPPPCPLRRSTP